ncbi:MAG: DUF389 domain-containing protein [Bellilinea sp.]|jgi:uncharacterized membrane protein
MSIPTSEPLLPEDENRLPPARRRRVNRQLLPPIGDERAAFLHQLANQVIPGYEFFLYALLAAVVLSLAIIFDSPALYLLAVLFAPFLGPVMGLSLAVVVGSGRFFLKALGSLLVAGALFFVVTLLAGWLSRMLLPGLELTQRLNFMVFNVPNFIVLALGVGLANFMLARSARQKPLVASVAIAYQLFIPLGVAGFSLAYGAPAAWVDGLIVFVVHLAWAALIGAVVLFVMGLKPTNLFGYTLGTSLVLIGVIAVVMITGLMTSNRPVVVALPPTATATVLAATTPSPVNTPITTATLSPVVVTETATATIRPTFSPTQTVTPEPTPVWARVSARDGDGAFVRDEPNGTVLTSLFNGSLVQVISEPMRGQGTTLWVKVRTDTGLEGWMMQALLATATPAPNW